MPFYSEFKKNVKAELSTTRLILMPIGIAAFFALIYVSNDETNILIEKIHWWSVLLTAIILFVGGNRIVSESVISEVNSRTWISQKMTSISPFEMTIGKLFGSTIYSWYGSLFCIVGYIIAAAHLPDIFREIKFLIIILSIGLLSHAFTLMISFLIIRKAGHSRKLDSTGVFLLGILVSGTLLYYALDIHQHVAPDTLNWYFLKLNYYDFGILSMLFFTLWACIGVYRNMREELHYENGSLVWILFLLTSMLLFSGLITNIDALNVEETLLVDFYISYFIAILFTYIMAFIEPKNIVDFRMLFQKVRRREWRDLQLALPLWFISLSFAVIICLAIISYSLISDKLSLFTSFISILFPVNLLLFMLRDIGLLLLVNLSDKIKRADFATFLLLMILYVVFPSVSKFLDLNLFASFIPVLNEKFYIGTIPIFFQFAMVLFFLIRLWRIKHRVEVQGR